MEDTLHSYPTARTQNRLRLFIGSQSVREPDTADGNKEHERPVSREIDAMLSGIIGNARLLRLDAPNLPDPVSRRIDAIVDSAQKITALLNRPDFDPPVTDSPDRDDSRR